MRSRVFGAIIAAVVATVLAAVPTRAVTCVGDCDGHGSVTVDEIVLGTNIALGVLDLTACPAFDATGDGRVEVDQIIAAVNAALDGCPAVPTASPTTTPTASPSPTPTPTRDPGVLTVAGAAARNAQGVSLRLNQTVTTEGIVTVAAGLFANNKLKVFAQDDGAGIMLYHENSGAVDAFKVGDRVRATGVIRQADPTSTSNAAKGTVLVDLSHGSWQIRSTNNPLPTPVAGSLQDVIANGPALTGTLVRVRGIHKVSGSWPQTGGSSTEVTVGDPNGNAVPMRFQRPVLLSTALTATLAAIGTGTFDAEAILVQDDASNSGTLLSGFQLWIRGAADIVPLPPP